ncbi:ParA family protein [Paenibacillus jiagnxiensis]|uniref:ParA family protein n=1 Tax=Paenibacillus jiagnxiensis TaxID=3228926 RepID=UPI0033A70B96
MGLIYAVATTKGGVGKTSFVSNLGAAVARTQPHARVLLVDTDPKGNLAIAFGKSPVEFTLTIYDVLAGEVPIQDVKVPLIDGLDLIPANQRMFNFPFAASPNPLDLLKGMIEEVREQYDFIFIDIPSDIGMLTSNVLGAADRIIIPFEPELFAVAALVQMTDIILNFQKNYRPELIIDGVVAMKVDEVTGLNAEMLPLVREYCGAKGFGNIDIPDFYETLKKLQFHVQQGHFPDTNKSFTPSKSNFEYQNAVHDLLKHLLNFIETSEECSSDETREEEKKQQLYELFSQTRERINRSLDSLYDVLSDAIQTGN